ncbi:hypothetical protein EBT16_02510 [bacterium]|nr:hypothetical protein [bacterium]
MNAETKSVQKRAFELLYGEFDKIKYMSHWGSGHRPPTGTTRMLYRWDRYLKKLKGVRRETLKDFIISFKPELKENEFVAVDPATHHYNRGGADGRVRMLVIDMDFALKILTFGLPDIRAMKYRVPRDWEAE